MSGQAIIHKLGQLLLPLVNYTIHPVAIIPDAYNRCLCPVYAWQVTRCLVKHGAEFDIVIFLELLIIFALSLPCLLVVIECATPLELLLRELVLEDRRLQARLLDDVLIKAEEK